MFIIMGGYKGGGDIGNISPNFQTRVKKYYIMYFVPIFWIFTQQHFYISPITKFWIPTVYNTVYI